MAAFFRSKGASVMWVVRISILPLAAVALLGQPRPSAADVETGARLYRTNCAGCHGANGDQVADVDLGHGVFRRAASDADLTRIITTGNLRYRTLVMTAWAPPVDPPTVR